MKKLDLTNVIIGIINANNFNEWLSTAKESGLSYEKTAYASGYVPVGKIVISPYCGRYGVGVTVDQHNDNSTRYKIRSYYVYTANI